MKTKLIWKEVPAEIHAAIEPHLVRWLGVVPGWCIEIVVRWNPDCTDASLRADVRPQYRDAILEICPSWFDMDEGSREVAIVHELSHIVAGPLVNFARETIEELVEEGSPLRRVLDRQCTNVFEGVVEDQARAFVAQRAI